ncbi:MAG: hydrogenase nickel incorporation protein HypB [Myxococcaceae bacterium]
MCTTCGCSEDAVVTLGPPARPHRHPHLHGHVRVADLPQLSIELARPADRMDSGHARLHRLEQDVLAKSDRIAASNRDVLADRRILALNLMSSPGAGKTTLLERTIRMLGVDHPLSVIEGDQETSLDAERIRDAGASVLQVNTGTGCHLDAEMIRRAMEQLSPPSGSVLFIENVGNLVCPALFDLGERAKVVIMSVTEGEDKPLKYPHMFRASALMLLNKVDLLPHVEFDVERCIAAARRINPGIEVLQVSARRGDGMEAWCGWVHARIAH